MWNDDDLKNKDNPKNKNTYMKGDMHIAGIHRALDILHFAVFFNVTLLRSACLIVSSCVSILPQTTSPSPKHTDVILEPSLLI